MLKNILKFLNFFQFRSKRTRRGPLMADWQDKCKPCMCVYKVVTCSARAHFPGAEKLVVLVSFSKFWNENIQFFLFFRSIEKSTSNSISKFSVRLIAGLDWLESRCVTWRCNSGQSWIRHAILIWPQLLHDDEKEGRKMLRIVCDSDCFIILDIHNCIY